MISKPELIANALALCLVTYPVFDWVTDLSDGKIVDVAGPWWMFWLGVYTLIVGWSGASFYRWFK